MKPKRPNRPKPLRGDPRRSAVDVIAAFRYQILQSAHAWLLLKDGEVLYLEGAEDFDVASARSTQAVQVKTSLARITLNSLSVRQALKSYSFLTNQNPGTRVYYRLITRAPIGIERGHPFGRGVGGLTLWRSPHISDGQVHALRAHLLTLPLDSSTSAILSAPDGQQYMRELLQRISWDVGSPDAELVESAVKEKLILHGHKGNVPAAESAAVLSSLITEVLRSASSHRSRALTRASFIELFDSATRVSIRRQVYDSLMRLALPETLAAFPGTESVALTVAPETYQVPPLPAWAQPRTALVSKILPLLRANYVAWLYGAVGYGKSLLANILVRGFSGDWLWIPLRGLSINTLPPLFRGVTRTVEATAGITGVVLDDVDADLALSNPFTRSVGAMIYELKRKRIAVTVTSHRRMPRALHTSLDLSDDCLQKVPPFSRVEIAAFALAEGCPSAAAKEWAGVVELHTKGHPQLVHTRIVGLKRGGWPAVGSSDIFSPGTTIEDERSDVRRSLVHSLQPEHRELIYRLSLVPSVFRRDQAMHLARITPPLDRPGDIFDLLAGPWLEELAGGYFRLSALLDGIAVSALDADTLTTYRKGICARLLRCPPITPIEIGAVLMLAVATRAAEPLVVAIQSVLRASRESRPSVYEHLWWVKFVAVGDEETVFVDRPIADFMLRMLQFKIAVHEGSADAVSAAERWERSIRPHEPLKSEDLERYMCASTVLVAHEVPISAHMAVRVLIQLGALHDRGAFPMPASRELTRRLGLGCRPFDPLRDFFVFVTARSSDPEYLADLLGALSGVDEDARRRILGALEADGLTARLLIDRCWMTEAERSAPNWKRCLDVFELTAAKATAWACPTLMVAAVRGIAIVFDEYLQDPATALLRLETAQQEAGRLSTELTDGTATVMLHQGRFAEALAVWVPLIRDWTVDVRNLDFRSIFACRNAAIAAWRLGQWEEAARLLEDGAARCRSLNKLVSAAGFAADAAFALYKTKGGERAVDLLGSGLSGIEASTTDDRERFVLSKRLGHTLAWIAGDTERRPSALTEPPPAFCSDFEIRKDILDMDPTPIEAMWLHLAHLEYHVSKRRRVFDQIRARLELAHSPQLRFLFAELSVRHAIRAKHKAALLSTAARMTETLNLARSHGDKVAESADPPADGLTRTALLGALVAWSGSRSGAIRLISQWQSQQSKYESVVSLYDWLSGARRILGGSLAEAMENVAKGDAKDQSRFLGALRVCLDDDATPAYSFLAGVLLVQLFAVGPWMRETGSGLASLLSRRWLHLSKTPALLRSPRFTIPAIQQACRGKANNIGMAARILLAAELSVRVTLPEEVLRLLRDLATIQRDD